MLTLFLGISLCEITFVVWDNPVIASQKYDQDQISQTITSSDKVIAEAEARLEQSL